jgi:WD40 repeat protein
VTLWDLNGGMPSRILQGHTWIVQGVGWSPDGRFLASCSLDGVLLLWDSTSLSCVQKFDDPSVTLVSMAWSPDGSLLACGTYQRGIQVWDMTTRSLYYVGQIYQTPFHCVTWSPNGEQLVGGGEGCMYLWERTDGTGQEQAAAPGWGLALI